MLRRVESLGLSAPEAAEELRLLFRPFALLVEFGDHLDPVLVILPAVEVRAGDKNGICRGEGTSTRQLSICGTYIAYGRLALPQAAPTSHIDPWQQNGAPYTPGLPTRMVVALAECKYGEGSTVLRLFLVVWRSNALRRQRPASHRVHPQWRGAVLRAGGRKRVN